MSTPEEVKAGLEGDPTAVDGAGDALGLAHAPHHHHDAEEDDDMHGEGKKDDQPAASRRFFPR